MTEQVKPIDNVDIYKLQAVLSGVGLNLSYKELDVIIDAVELIEDKAGNVTIDDILNIKKDHYVDENARTKVDRKAERKFPNDMKIKDLEEMFKMEQELDIPYRDRWYKQDFDKRELESE